MTANRERDQLLENSLKHGLSSAAAWATDSECLDAEALAAWVDGGLDRQHTALAEMHLSNCGQCQALVAALAHVLPPGAAKKKEGSRGVWRWWFAPVAATAAAVVIWIVVPQRGYLAPPRTPNAAVEQAPPPPVTAPPAAVAAPAADVLAAQPANEPARLADRLAPAPAPARPSVNAPSPAPPPAVAARTGGVDSRPAGPPSPAAGPPAERAGLLASRRDQATNLAEAPAAAKAEGVATAPRAPPANQRATAGLGLVLSPDDRVRWRYSASGLHYSTDGGAAWELVSTAIGPFVTAGSAPSTTVCWLVARGGGVFVTGDGRTFFRARFPEITNLVGVTATSRAAASVVSADDRTFVTADGGVTWRRP